MIGRLRLPFFLIALLVIAVVVLVERSTVDPNRVVAAMPAFLKRDSLSLKLEPSGPIKKAVDVFPGQSPVLDKLRVGRKPLPSQVEGLAIPSMQFVDGTLLFTILLMGLALLIPANLHAKIQGVLTLIFGIVLIILSIVRAFMAVGKLLLMVALLFSFPFGTLAYLFIFGSFPRDSMSAVLALLFALRLLFAVLLLLAHQGFIKNLGLVIFVVVAFVAGIVVSFLYGIVPGILVSITDAIAAIVVCIIAIILGLVLAIGSLPSIIKIVQVW